MSSINPNFFIETAGMASIYRTFSFLIEAYNTFN